MSTSAAVTLVVLGVLLIAGAFWVLYFTHPRLPQQLLTNRIGTEGREPSSPASLGDGRRQPKTPDVRTPASLH